MVHLRSFSGLLLDTATAAITWSDQLANSTRCVSGRLSRNSVLLPGSPKPFFPFLWLSAIQGEILESDCHVAQLSVSNKAAWPQDQDITNMEDVRAAGRANCLKNVIRPLVQ